MTTMTTIKETPKELSRIALDLIKQNPEQWDQRSWHIAKSCGTCHCYAGWIDHYLSTTYPEEKISQCYLSDISDLDPNWNEETQLVWNIEWFLKLINTGKYEELINSDNSYQRLVQLHNKYFKDDYSVD